MKSEFRNDVTAEERAEQLRNERKLREEVEAPSTFFAIARAGVVTARTWAEVEAVRKLLMKLARRYRLRMIEISELAKLAADQKEEERLRAEFAVMEEEGWRVPEPEAEVNLAMAMKMYRHDALCGVEHGDSLEEIAAVAENQYRWAKFWAARHPSPEGREEFAEMVAEVDVLRARTKAKVDELIARAHAR
jgi:hypothetical protein